MNTRRSLACAVACLIVAATAASAAGSLQHTKLRVDLERIARGFDGRVGVCARDAAGVTCVNGDSRFPLQSVMKLVVGFAVMDAVDRRGWKLDERVTVHREDLSLFVQPLAELVTPDGFVTTVDDLIRRAIVDSDSAATDILIARLGGPKAVQAALNRHSLAGLRVDRDERHLQTESAGLTWRPEYVDAGVLNRALAAVPETRRDASFRAYQKDPRDTATPKGMVALLQSLAEGKLLSASSTRRLLDIMEQTVTFPNRLKAGVADGWTLAHKTGTSGTWRGITAATNDVGVLTGPDGTKISVAVFIADSRASPESRAALMAAVARATIENCR